MKNRLFLCAVFILGFWVTQASAQDDKKFAIAIVIDNTGSLRPELPFAKELASEFVKIAGVQGSMSVIRFRTDNTPSSPVARASIGANWLGNTDALTTYIDSLATVPGRTALIDAIYLAAERVALKVEQDKLSGGVVFVITDGEDRVSERRADELIMYLGEKGIRVLVAGLVKELKAERGFITGTAPEKARSILRDLTEKTGGQVVFRTKETAREIINQLLTVPVSNKK